MRWFFVVLLLLLLLYWKDWFAPPETVKLYNPATGRTAQCGPYDAPETGPTPAIVWQSECLQYYRRRGYVRQN